MEMTVDLIDTLKQVEDFRSARGRRYPLWLVLLLVILGMMSQCQGYLSLEDFAERHKAVLVEALGLPLRRLPSDSTFRLILQRLDYSRLVEVFNDWAQQHIAVEPGVALSADGKGIAGTLTEHKSDQQNFISLVSLYCQHSGVVLRVQAFENQHQSEIEVVQQLLSALHLEGNIVTLDALHAQKKTIQTVLKQGNDFLIALKANQGRLLQALLSMRLEQEPEQVESTHEVSRNRSITRTLRVYACAGRFEPDWSGICRAICLEQSGTRAGKPYFERRWFISSLCTSASRFADLIRQHWQIENGLHWVKDVVLHEDRSPLSHPNVAINTSICRNFVINLLRLSGFDSITQALRTIAHDIPRLLHLSQ